MKHFKYEPTKHIATKKEGIIYLAGLIFEEIQCNCNVCWPEYSSEQFNELVDYLPEIIDKVFKKKNPRSHKMLLMRYGIRDGNPHTYKELGIEFGLTQERIRQVILKAQEILCDHIGLDESDCNVAACIDWVYPYGMPEGRRSVII